MFKLILIIYFIWGVSYNFIDFCYYLVKSRKIKFVVTAEEGYIPIRARILKSIVVTLINIFLLVIVFSI